MAKCCIVELASAKKSSASLKGEVTWIICEESFCFPWFI